MYLKQALWLYIIFGQALLTKLALSSEEATEPDLIIQTLTGPVEGIAIKSFSDQDVVAYYGIPYAEPPIGDLRFKPPVPVQPWTNTLKASRKPLPCYQQLSTSRLEYARKSQTNIPRPWSEDCLTLNVWIPRPTPDEEGLGIPILVFLHGGNFQRGSNLLPYSDGNTLAAFAGTYTVSVNYRLGPFGFLSFGHPDAPGNMGLLDQQVAIKWVKDNIHTFGGRTGNIILWGLGAGGASTGYQMISPGNAGVFTSASPRGGSPTCSWAFQSQDVALKKANSLAAKLGCYREDVSEEIQCLRNQHPEDILDADMEDVYETNEYFKPTLDGTFITQSPIDALRSGNFNNVSVLSVTTAQDGSAMLLAKNYNIMANATEAGLSPSDFLKVVKRVVPDLTDAIFSMVKDFYVDQCAPEDPFKLLDAAVRLYTDIMVDCCVESFLDYVSEKSSVVRVVYEQTLEKNPKWMGTVHGTDQLFFHGYPILGEKAGYTEDEGNKSRELIKAVSFFSKRSFLRLDLFARVYDAKTRPYHWWAEMSFNGNHYRHKECSLWNEIIPKLQNEKNTCTPIKIPN